MNPSSVTLSLDDKRRRLSQKIPAAKFTVDEYPSMHNPGNPEQKSGNLGKIIPIAYGYCLNIPAFCVDEFDIYLDEDLTTLKPDRTFKVCQKIIRIDSVMVKMTQPSDGSGSKEVWIDQRTKLKSIDYNNGTFVMNRQYCMPDFLDGYEVPEMFEVMVTGIFGLPENDCVPSKILADLMLVYGGVAFNAEHYNIGEFNSELAPLSKIGLYLDKEQDLYTVIELLQNGSNYGFQFMTDFDKFTAKRNDDERAVKTQISQSDILNPSEVEFSANTDEYATIVDVGYNTNHKDGTNERLINKENRGAILYLYKVEKAYQVDSLLYGVGDVQGKVLRLANYFSEPRPVISNIALFGRKWFDLKCYDIVDIDLRFTEHEGGREKTVIGSLAEGQSTIDVMGIENAGRRTIITHDFGERETIRKFIGRIKGKVIRVEKNVKDETVKIDVVKLGDIQA
jgi:hypothetical protein